MTPTPRLLRLPLAIPLPTLSTLSSNLLEIDFHLDQLTSVLTQIALSTIPTSKPSPHKRPGWSDDLNAAHRQSKNAYKLWRAAGRPRNPDHLARMQYKEAKRKFRLKLHLHAKEQREEFFANLDLNTSNPSKLFRIIQKHNGLTPEPTRILHHQGMAYTNEHVLEGWENILLLLVLMLMLGSMMTTSKLKSIRNSPSFLPIRQRMKLSSLTRKLLKW